MYSYGAVQGQGQLGLLTAGEIRKRQRHLIGDRVSWSNGLHVEDPSSFPTFGGDLLWEIKMLNNETIFVFI